jgi:SAM-dependent methyltransferase
MPSLLSRLKESGIYGRIRAAKRGLEHFLHERGLADTSEPIESEDLGHTDPEFTRYEASAWRWLPRALRGRRIGADDVFVDIGSGKGRVVLAASRLPFGRVVGVEISESLNEVARSNLAADTDQRRCGEIELVTADATEWEIPAEANYVYFLTRSRATSFAA